MTNTNISAIDSAYLQRRNLLLICVVSVIGLAPWLPLFDLDEGAFTEATREILSSGNWVSTYLNGLPRHDKPILIYWLQATSSLFFGFNEFTLRLPTLACAFLWLMVVYRFAKEVMSEYAARLALFMLATAWLALPIFKAAIADALLNCLLCLIFFDIYRYTKAPCGQRLAKIGVLMGLGFLAKGPVAVILPLGSFFFAMAYQRQLKLWFVAVFNLRSILPFLIVVVPWHIAVYFDQGWAFFEGFYLGHNLGRFNETMEDHGGSPFYYLLLMPVLLMPFSRQFFMSLWEAKQQPKDLLHPFLISWFCLTLLIFSFSKTQLPHYMLYGLTPAFLLVAYRISTNTQAVTSLDWGFGLSGLSLFCLFPLLVPAVLNSINHPYEYAITAFAYQLFLNKYIYLAVAILLLALTLFFRSSGALNKLLASSVCIALCINFVVMPLMAEAQQTPVKEAATVAKKFGGKVVSYQVTMPSFSVYRDAIVTKELPQQGNLVFTRVHAIDQLQQLSSETTLYKLYEKGGIVLYRYGQAL